MALTQITTNGIKDGTITGTDLTTNVDFVDNQKLRLGTGNDLQIYHDGTNSTIYNSTGLLNLQNDGDDINLYAADDITLFVQGSESAITCIGNGAVELYFDNVKQVQTFSSGLNWQDNKKAEFGNSGDLKIYHDGTDSFIKNTTGNLIIGDTTGNVILQGKFGEDSLICKPDGAVEINFDNNKKFETTSSGATVTGSLTTDGFTSTTSGDAIFTGTTSGRNAKWDTSHDRLIFDDNAKAVFGSGADLQIYHDGTDSKITNTTGNLIIDHSNGIIRLDPKTNENGILIRPDGAVELYFDNVKKFFTHSEGVTVESTGNTPKLKFRGASNLDLATIDVDQFATNYSMMRFFTLANGTVTEWMRLLDNGNFCVGGMVGSSSNSNIQSPGQGNGNTNVGSAMWTEGRFICNSASTFSSFGRNSTGTVISFTRQGGDQGSIGVAVGSVSFNTSSDYRLKENVVSITDGITRVKQLLPKRFNFIEDTTNTLRDGFLAHEVSSIVPESITGTKDEVDSDNNPVHQSIDQSKLVPLLVAALQEAITKIETLETEVAALKAG